jgi:hypothetical protein
MLTNSTFEKSEIDEKRTVQYCKYCITIATRTHPVGCTFGCVACALHSLYGVVGACCARASSRSKCQEARRSPKAQKRKERTLRKSCSSFSVDFEFRITQFQPSAMPFCQSGPFFPNSPKRSRPPASSPSRPSAGCENGTREQDHQQGEEGYRRDCDYDSDSSISFSDSSTSQDGGGTRHTGGEGSARAENLFACFKPLANILPGSPGGRSSGLGFPLKKAVLQPPPVDPPRMALHPQNDALVSASASSPTNGDKSHREEGNVPTNGDCNGEDEINSNEGQTRHNNENHGHDIMVGNEAEGESGRKNDIKEDCTLGRTLSADYFDVSSMSSALHGLSMLLHLKPARTLEQSHNTDETAATGVIMNQWSAPPASIFFVRGPNYLADYLKTQSLSPSLFQARGVDVFQTTSIPRDIAGQCPQLLGGAVRRVPTFVINLRFSWGILACYFEIPTKFTPFIRHYDSIQHQRRTPVSGDKNDGFEKEAEQLISTLKDMIPGERCLARFLMASQEDKNYTLKLIPVVVEGEDIVKHYYFSYFSLQIPSLNFFHHFFVVHSLVFT